jgi:hypothetical protein
MTTDCWVDLRRAMTAEHARCRAEHRPFGVDDALAGVAHALGLARPTAQPPGRHPTSARPTS